MKNSLKSAKLDIVCLGMPWLCLLTAYSAGFICIFYFVGDISFPVICAGSQVIAMFAVYSPFLFQERDKFTLLYGTLPLSIKEIVQGRYIYMFFIFGIFFIKDCVIFICYCLFQGMFFSFGTIVQGLVLSFFILALNSTLIPALYKFGLMKGAGYFSVQFFVILIGFCLLTGTEILSHLMMLWNSYQLIFLIAVILLSSLILLITYRAAVAAYRERCWI